MGYLGFEFSFVALLQIFWVDLLLSGDNAIVIAMACRALPQRDRVWGIILGSSLAVGLRLLFAIGITTLMAWPWLKLGGGLVLFWVALKLLKEDEQAGEGLPASSLWHAVWMILVADVVMSLDNVIAIAAIAKGSWGLLVLGITMSIPLVLFGSSLLLRLIERFSWMVWLGAALLGWIAGTLIAHEVFIEEFFVHWPLPLTLHTMLGLFGIAIVLLVGWRMNHAK